MKKVLVVLALLLVPGMALAAPTISLRYPAGWCRRHADLRRCGWRRSSARIIQFVVIRASTRL